MALTNKTGRYTEDVKNRIYENAPVLYKSLQKIYGHLNDIDTDKLDKRTSDEICIVLSILCANETAKQSIELIKNKEIN